MSHPNQLQTSPFPPSLTDKDILQGAVNSPALAADEFQLGDRTFKVLDLGYDDYVQFLFFVKPIFEALGKAVTLSPTQVPDIDLGAGILSITNIMDFCLKDLPEMCRIVCAQTAPEITVTEVKALARNPMKMTEVVLKQIVRNNMIKDFTSFFHQILALMPKKMTAPTA